MDEAIRIFKIGSIVYWSLVALVLVFALSPLHPVLTGLALYIAFVAEESIRLETIRGEARFVPLQVFKVGYTLAFFGALYSVTRRDPTATILFMLASTAQGLYIHHREPRTVSSAVPRAQL